MASSDYCLRRYRHSSSRGGATSWCRVARRICILGVAASALEKGQVAEIPEDAEIWAVNEGHRVLGDRKPARIFQMHVRDWRESERIYLNHGTLPEHLDHDCFGRNAEHVEYLRTCDVPVYGQQVWPDIPTSVEYPFEAVEEAVGIRLPPRGRKRLWATSSFGYMLALVLTEHRKECPSDMWHPQRVDEVQLLAVELALGTRREQLWEWPNLAYYLGLATGLGIKVTLPSTGTSLLSAPYYALDGHPHVQEADHWWVPGPADVIWDDEEQLFRLGTQEPL